MAIKILRGGLKTDQASGNDMGRSPIDMNQEPDQESLLGSVGRNIARTGVRNIPALAAQFNPVVGTALLGGEVAQGLGNLYSSYVPQGLQDFFQDTGAFMTAEKVARAHGAENPEQYESVSISDYLPTGANIQRGLSPYLPEGYLQQQSPSEQALDDFTTIAGSAYQPLLGGIPKTAGQAVTRGALGAIGGAGARAVGLEGLPETAVKVGASLVPDLAQLLTAPSQVQELVDQGYETAESIGEYLPVEGDTIQKEMNKLLKQAKRMGDTPSTQALTSNASKLLNAADSNGMYKASDLVRFKQSMNELYGPSAMNKVINKINDPIIDALKKVGQEVPLFGESFFPAEESWKALNTVGSAQKFLEKTIPQYAKTGAAYYGLSALLKGNIGKAAAIAVGGPISQSGAKFYDFINRSTQAQTILGRMMDNISSDAKERVIKDFNQLNKLYEKETKKEQPKIDQSIKVLRGGLKSDLR